MHIPPVLERLSYRYPSVLVDAVTEHEPGRRIVAVKNVTVNEEFFQGHFPGTPLMPGVLMIESLAQVATLLLSPAGSGGGCAWLRGVDNAKFRRQVVPATVSSSRSRSAGGADGWRARVGGRVGGRADSWPKPSCSSSSIRRHQALVLGTAAHAA